MHGMIIYSSILFFVLLTFVMLCCSYFIGNCISACKMFGMVGTASDVPVVSMGCETSARLAEPGRYRRFQTVSVFVTNSVDNVFKVVQKFRWKKFVVVISPDIDDSLISSVFANHCQNYSMTCLTHTLKNTPVFDFDAGRIPKNSAKELEKEMNTIKRKGSVILLAMPDIRLAIYMLLAACKIGILDKGDYALLVLNAGSDEKCSDVLFLLAMLLRSFSGFSYLPPMRITYVVNGFKSTFQLTQVPDAVQMILRSIEENGRVQAKSCDEMEPLFKAGDKKTDTLDAYVDCHGHVYKYTTFSAFYYWNRISRFAWFTIVNGKKHAKFNISKVNTIFWPGGGLVIPGDEPFCGLKDEKCNLPESDDVFLIFVLVGYLLFVVLLFIYLVHSQLVHMETLREIEDWIIPWKDLEFEDDKFQTAEELLQGEEVAVKRINVPTIDYHERYVITDIKKVIKFSSNDNLNRFIGVCVEPDHVAIIMLYASRGSLDDIIRDKDNASSAATGFLVSMLSDIAAGMMYLHNSSLGSHGHLCSFNCIVDSQWTCKITDFGLMNIKKGEIKDIIENDEYYEGMMWTAPELLRLHACPPYGTKAGDVYSFAIIAQQIILTSLPFFHERAKLKPKDIIKKVMEVSDVAFRPRMPRQKMAKDNIAAGWKSLISSCWAENPEFRLTFDEILVDIETIEGGKDADLVVRLMQNLEKYAHHLKDLVAQRTKRINKERRAIKGLLRNLLPPSVEALLATGKEYEPETFHGVSIYQADIVHFTNFAATCTPMQIINLLNELFSNFDDITKSCDAFKIETIGDAYLVASGAPRQNGDRHASVICELALRMLSSLYRYEIPDKHKVKLQLRIGIHSGTVVTGVVGVKTPRFIFFGETSFIASKCESGGSPNMIQITSTTMKTLSKTPGFVLRGRKTLLELWAGRPPIQTFFLIRKIGLDLELPDMQLDLDRLAFAEVIITKGTNENALERTKSEKLPTGGSKSALAASKSNLENLISESEADEQSEISPTDNDLVKSGAASPSKKKKKKTAKNEQDSELLSPSIKKKKKANNEQDEQVSDMLKSEISSTDSDLVKSNAVSPSKNKKNKKKRKKEDKKAKEG